MSPNGDIVVDTNIHFTHDHLRLSNEKPSAIFRVKSISNMLMAEPSDAEAIIGIAIEPLQAVLDQVAAMGLNQGSSTSGTALTLARQSPVTSSSRLTDPTYLAQRIGQHLFNFLSSFAVSGAGGDSVIISMADLNSWYEKLVAKIKNGGTAFLEGGI